MNIWTYVRAVNVWLFSHMNCPYYCTYFPPIFRQYMAITFKAYLTSYNQYLTTFFLFTFFVSFITYSSTFLPNFLPCQMWVPLGKSNSKLELSQKSIIASNHKTFKSEGVLLIGQNQETLYLIQIFRQKKIDWERKRKVKE